MIELSLNEVEQLATKVACGVGYSWGLAEDVARAARVLAEAGLPWSEALTALAEFARHPTPSLACPILTAARLGDDPSAWSEAPAAARRVAVPLWVAACLADGCTTTAWAIHWDRAALTTAAGVLVPDATRDNWLPASADLEIAVAPWPPSPFARQSRARVDERALSALHAIAERIYVPASAVSRARGAGGGSVDDE
jgi:hypothetical protein